MVFALLFQDTFEFLDLNEPDNLLSHKGFQFYFHRFLIKLRWKGKHAEGLLMPSNQNSKSDEALKSDHISLYLNINTVYLPVIVLKLLKCSHAHQQTACKC